MSFLTPEELKKLREGNKNLSKNDTLVDWGEKFVKSSLYGAGSLIGLDAPPDVLQWEHDNPLSSAAAQFFGVGVPYAGWYKASKSIGRFEKFVRAFGDVEKAPVLGTALQEAVRFAPLEAGRIAGTALIAPDKLPEVGLSSVIDLGVAGAAGALAGVGRAFGAAEAASAAKMRGIVPGMDDSLPRTLQLRKLQEALKSGTVAPNRVEEAQRWAAQLDSNVRREEIINSRSAIDADTGSRIGFERSRQRYADKLATPRATGFEEPLKARSAKWLDAFFRPQESGKLEVRKLVEKTHGEPFGIDGPEKLAHLNSLLPPNASAYMQYPRFLQINNESLPFQKMLSKRFSEHMVKIADGTFMTREVNDGMFVMMKRLAPTDRARELFGKGDEWLLWKTDKPGVFEPKAENWNASSIAQSAWASRYAPENIHLPEGTAWAHVQKMQKEVPIGDFFDSLSQPRDEKGFLAKVASGLGFKPGDTLPNAARGTLAFMQEYFSPTAFQFATKAVGGERARYILGNVRSTFDWARAKAETAVFGTVKVRGNSPLASVWLAGAREGVSGPSLSDAVKKLNDVDRQRLGLIEATGINIDTVKEQWMHGGISDELYDFVKLLHAQDEERIARLHATERAAGVPQSNFLKGHYQLARMWDGDWRLFIRDEKDAPVYLVGAKTRGGAIDEAKRIIQDSGQKWKFDASSQQTKDLFLRNAERPFEDLGLAAQVNVNSRSFRLASAAQERAIRSTITPKALGTGRRNQRGYLADMSNEGLLDRLFTHVNQLEKYMADLSLRANLTPQMMRLADDNPTLFRQVNERWDQQVGKQSLVAEAQNAILDRALAPVLGKNSATKIVRTLNTVTHNFMLGMGNLQFPVVNMLTFMQTVLPHVAFVGTASLEKAAQFYTSFAAAGRDGLVRRSFHMLDPMKLTYQGFRLMRSPTAAQREHFVKALNEGILAPLAVEEHIGLNAQVRQKMHELLAEQNGFVKFAQYLSEFLPNKSEQFSRLHAFTTGLVTGEKLLGFQGDGLYRFAKEFTHHTMFGYTSFDRAKVITGPLGSFLGLYKNWQMHYLAWFMQYAGMAMHGNMLPLMWGTAGTTAVAGIGGTALYGIGDTFSRSFTSKPLISNLYSMLSTDEDGQPDLFSDAAFFGLPAFLGVSLQGSASTPGANPARDASMLWSFVQMERAKNIGQVLGASVDTWGATGESPLADPLIRSQLIRALAPRSVLRTAQVVESDYVKSLTTGQPIAEIGQGQKFLYGLGFNTPDIDRAYKISDELYKSQEKRRLAIRAFARQFVQLQDAGNWEALDTLLTRAAISGVGIDSVLRSADSMKERRMQTLVSSRIDMHTPEWVTQQFDNVTPAGQ